MTYPCGIIRDLLPLYIDDVCNEESKNAVELHLVECEKCRQYYESMKVIDGFVEKQNNELEDVKMVNSLKNIKLKINRKNRNIIICSIIVILVFLIGFQLLYSMPIKEIDIEDINVSAIVYSVNELPQELIMDEDYVKISRGEADTSNAYKIEIPAMPNAEISITEDVMKNNEFVTVVSWNSPYFIREIKWGKSPEESGDTLYVKSFKTTVLNNKTPINLQTTQSLEFKEINKIVFVDDNGAETILWSK